MWGWMRRRLAGAAVRDRNRHTDQPFDVAEIGPLLVIAKRNRNAFGTGTRSTTDAVNVAFGNIGKVVVDHVADAINVDAACGNIRRNERTQLAVAKGCEHTLPLVLRLVAVNCFCRMTRLLKPTHHLVCAMTSRFQRRNGRVKTSCQRRWCGRSFSVAIAIIWLKPRMARSCAYWPPRARTSRKAVRSGSICRLSAAVR